MVRFPQNCNENDHVSISLLVLLVMVYLPIVSLALIASLTLINRLQPGAPLLAVAEGTQIRRVMKGPFDDKSITFKTAILGPAATSEM